MRIERLLMDGVFSNGLGFEKLNTDGSMGTLFSIRLNNKARLLLTKVWLVHGWYWVLLDVLEKHEYDRSKLLASGGLTHFFQSHRLKLEQDIRDNGHEVILPQQEEARAEGAEWVDFEFFNHQLIVLNEQQDDAAQTNLPIIVNGIPGSGKTCVVMSLLMQCLDANSERILYVTSSNDLVSSMCATWRQAPSYDAADEAKLSLKSYKTLINQIFLKHDACNKLASKVSLIGLLNTENNTRI